MKVNGRGDKANIWWVSSIKRDYNFLATIGDSQEIMMLKTYLTIIDYHNSVFPANLFSVS